MTVVSHRLRKKNGSQITNIEDWGVQYTIINSINRNLTYNILVPPTYTISKKPILNTTSMMYPLPVRLF